MHTKIHGSSKQFKFKTDCTGQHEICGQICLKKHCFRLKRMCDVIHQDQIPDDFMVLLKFNQNQPNEEDKLEKLPIRPIVTNAATATHKNDIA